MNIVYIRNYAQKMEIMTDKTYTDKRVYDAFSQVKKLTEDLNKLFNELPSSEVEYQNKKLDIFRAAVYLESLLAPYHVSISKRYQERATIAEYTTLLKELVIKDSRNIDYLCFLNFMYSLATKAASLEFNLTPEEAEFFEHIKKTVGEAEVVFLNAN